MQYYIIPYFDSLYTNDMTKKIVQDVTLDQVTGKFLETCKKGGWKYSKPVNTLSDALIMAQWPIKEGFYPVAIWAKPDDAKEKEEVYTLVGAGKKVENEVNSFCSVVKCLENRTSEYQRLEKNGSHKKDMEWIDEQISYIFHNVNVNMGKDEERDKNNNNISYSTVFNELLKLKQNENTPNDQLDRCLDVLIKYYNEAEKRWQNAKSSFFGKHKDEPFVDYLNREENKHHATRLVGLAIQDVLKHYKKYGNQHTYDQQYSKYDVKLSKLKTYAQLKQKKPTLASISGPGPDDWKIEYGDSAPKKK